MPAAPGSYKIYIFEPMVRRVAGWDGPVGSAMKRIARESVFGMKAKAPVLTGGLKNSFDHTAAKRRYPKTGIWFDVGSKKKHAAATDQGARPHIIAANQKPNLVFFWAKVGRVVRARSVFHPGNRAHLFMEKSVRAAIRSVLR